MFFPFVGATVGVAGERLSAVLAYVGSEAGVSKEMDLQGRGVLTAAATNLALEAPLIRVHILVLVKNRPCLQLFAADIALKLGLTMCLAMHLEIVYKFQDLVGPQDYSMTYSQPGFVLKTSIADGAYTGLLFRVNQLVLHQRCEGLQTLSAVIANVFLRTAVHVVLVPAQSHEGHKGFVADFAGIIDEIRTLGAMG